jgi:hypothetical protein
MLGGLSVPLRWGVVVPPDDYDHWAPKPDVNAEAPDETADDSRPATATDGARSGWEADGAPRTPGVIPHSPAAG